MHYSQLEGLDAERIRSGLGETEESRLAHQARVDSRAARTTLGKSGSKKSWRPDPRLSATRIACDTPGIRLNRRAP
jgi:hypothetical protein